MHAGMQTQTLTVHAHMYTQTQDMYTQTQDMFTQTVRANKSPTISYLHSVYTS